MSLLDGGMPERLPDYSGSRSAGNEKVGSNKGTEANEESQSQAPRKPLDTEAAKTGAVGSAMLGTGANADPSKVISASYARTAVPPLDLSSVTSQATDSASTDPHVSITRNEVQSEKAEEKDSPRGRRLLRSRGGTRKQRARRSRSPNKLKLSATRNKSPRRNRKKSASTESRSLDTSPKSDSGPSTQVDKEAQRAQLREQRMSQAKRHGTAMQGIHKFMRNTGAVNARQIAQETEHPEGRQDQVKVLMSQDKFDSDVYIKTRSKLASMLGSGKAARTEEELATLLQEKKELRASYDAFLSSIRTSNPSLEKGVKQQSEKLAAALGKIGPEDMIPVKWDRLERTPDSPVTQYANEVKGIEARIDQDMGFAGNLQRAGVLVQQLIDEAAIAFQNGDLALGATIAMKLDSTNFKMALREYAGTDDRARAREAVNGAIGEKHLAKLEAMNNLIGSPPAFRGISNAAKLTGNPLPFQIVAMQAAGVESFDESAPLAYLDGLADCYNRLKGR